MTHSHDTDTIIRKLAADAGRGERTTARSFEAGLLLTVAAGLACAVALVFFWFGVQPSLPETIRSAPFHHKVTAMLLLAAGGMVLVRHLGRPGSSPKAALALLPGLAILVVGALADQSGFPMLGRTSISVPSCVLAIVLLSVPALAMILGILRTGVTTRPTLAGGAAGLLAGGLGAAAYALACKNDGGGFVLVWYSVSLIIVGMAGAVTGRRVLAW